MFERDDRNSRLVDGINGGGKFIPCEGVEGTRNGFDEEPACITYHQKDFRLTIERVEMGIEWVKEGASGDFRSQDKRLKEQAWRRVSPWIIQIEMLI